jgi:hypothetical protein
MKDFGLPLGYVLSKEVFLDAGKSARSGKHIALDEFGRAKGELARFIQCVEEGKIQRNSILLIDDFSRFSRLTPFKSLKLFTDFIDSGIGLVFTGSYEKRIINQDLLNTEGNVLQFIIGELIRSYMESAERGRKIKEAKNTFLTNIKNGLVQRNNLPKYFSFVPNPGQKSIGKYIHNERTPILGELIGMFVAGKSLYSIAADLNRRGVRTFKGREWSGNGINKILRNRILCGEYKGIKNYVEPVVTEAEFNKIQTILNQNTFSRGKHGKLVHIFRGVCFCADPKCNSAMSIMSASFKGKIYRYLRCNSLARGKLGCTNHSSIPLPDMEAEFFYNYLFKNPHQLLSAEDDKELKQLKNSIAVNQIQLSKISAEIARLAAVNEKLSIDELTMQLAKLKKEREGIKAELDGLNFAASSVQNVPNAYGDLKVLVQTTKHKFKADKDGIPIFERNATDTEIEKIFEVLKNNKTREQIRVMLPSMIGKITVDTNEGQFYIYNRMGKLVYESFVYESRRNCTAHWRESLKRTKSARTACCCGCMTKRRTPPCSS